APLLVLTSDTGASSTDGLTNNPKPTVRVTAAAGSLLRLSVDGAAATMRVLSGPTEITLPRLSDGLHSVIATVEDLAGHASAPSAPLAFTIDTTAPSTPTLGFAAGFDTAPVGDGITSFERVTLSGHTDPLTAVALYRSYDLQTPIARGTSGAAGDFSFADVAPSTAA